MRQYVLWNTTISYLLVNLSSSLISNVLRFQIADGEKPPVNAPFPTPNNFCNGYLTNYINLVTISSAVSLFGNFFFQAFIVDMRPWYFLARFIVILQLFLCFVLVSLYFDLSVALSGVILAIVNVIQFFMTHYSNNLINGITPVDILGVSFLMQGVFTPLATMASVGLAFLAPPQWINVTVILAINALTVIHWIIWSIVWTDDIKKLDDKEEKQKQSSCMRKFVTGY